MAIRSRSKTLQQQQQPQDSDSDYYSRWLASKRPTTSRGVDQRAGRMVFKAVVMVCMLAVVVMLAAGTRLHTTFAADDSPVNGRTLYKRSMASPYVANNETVSGRRPWPAAGGRRLLEENEGVDVRACILTLKFFRK